MTIFIAGWRNQQTPNLAKLARRVNAPGENESLDPDLRFTPGEVIGACQEFTSLYPDSEFAGGHIVLSDCNLEARHIGWSLRVLLKELGTDEDCDNREAIDFLASLLLLDDDERLGGEPGDEEGG